MALKCIITASCISLLRSAQAQDGYNHRVVNPDAIYYDNADQMYPVNVLPLNNKQGNWQQNINAGRAPSAVPQNYNYGNAAVPLNNNYASNGVPQNNNFGNNAVPLNNNYASSGVPLNNNYASNGVPQYSNYGNNAVPLNNNYASNGVPQNNNYGSNGLPQNNVGLQRPSAIVQPTNLVTSNRFSGIADSNVGQSFTNASAVSLALSDFGINLMNNIRGQQGNLVVSPFSIATLLALLQQGSLGATQQQITAALQLTPSQANDGFRRFTQNLKKRSSFNIFKVANGIFMAENFVLNAPYKRIAKNDFGSEVTPTKFNRPDVTAQIINNWVSSKTNNKIDKLLTADSVGVNTQLILVNAVYFKGVWEVKFKAEATIPKDFHLGDGGKKKVPFMRMRRIFKTDIDQSINSQVLILPFKEDQYSLVLILPGESTPMASALALLTKEKLLSYHSFTPKEVAIEIPKFTVKSETDLVSVFRGLGIVNMFGPNAELSGIGTYREFSPQISSALHSAMMSIDEEGGVAAAATSFGVVALSYDDPSLVFKANRPFLAIIWDNSESIPLFMARIEDPAS